MERRKNWSTLRNVHCFHGGDDSFDNVLKDFGGLRIAEGGHKIDAVLGGQRQLRLDGNAAEERDFGHLGQGFAPARREDVGTLGAVRAHVAGHVLQNANYVETRLPAERQLSPYVIDGQELRRRDDDGSIALHFPI